MFKTLAVVLAISTLLGLCLTQCPDGTYKALDTTCQNCKTGCALCSSLNVCTKCISNYSFVNNSCISNNCFNFFCTKCSEEGKCSACISAYHPSSDGTKCVSEDSNCSNYSFINGVWTCTGCFNGYVYDKITGKCICELIKILRDGKCVDCSTIYPNCLGCTQTNCFACKEGYVFDPINKKCNGLSDCKNQVPNCAVCEGNFCVTCNADYILNTAANKCDYTPGSCKTPANLGCAICFTNNDIHYMNISNACVKVNTADCAIYYGRGIFTCERCLNAGWFKTSTSNADLCYSCRNQGCESCVNPLTMLCKYNKCKPGYTGTNCMTYQP